MRIGHCIHGLSLGGAQKVLETIVSSLDSPEFEHFVYCSIDGPIRVRIESTGASVNIIPRRWPKFDPALVRSLAKAIRSDQIDLMHTHLFGDSLHGFLAARSAGQIPVLMTLHNNQRRFSRLQQIGYRWILPRSTALVACAHSVGSSFVEAQPQLLDKLRVIPNGLTYKTPVVLGPKEGSSLRDDLGLDPNSLVLTAMGRFVEQKGYSHLIRAFSELPVDLQAATQLLLLGQGPLDQSLRDLSRSLGLSDRIIFGGYRLDIEQILSITEVVVFSSLWEGLPIALLESMAARKCIVATDIEGFRDAVDAETEAVLAPPEDPAALSKAIERVLADPALRVKLSAQAETRFLRDFTASKMVKEYENIYRDLCPRLL